ncbi:glycosyltransferase family 4 protein [Halolamina rubra]|uniref:glycosyltransferase family 4 protein n=1 Tax=Halolamina rubra TaxID=1380430 RepID=UPI0006794529|nr:glycosyltransferase family 4 protein [Halolamina rubra]
MKILQVTPRYPPNTGGVETHVKEISERLADRGHEVVVHTADLGPDVDGWELRNGVEVHRHRGFSPGEAFHIAPGIASSIRKTDADVVHAHNYHSFPLLFAALGVTDQRFVVTAHYHGESASDFRDRLLSLYHPFGKWAVKQADKVIAVSEWERDRLREDFGVDATVIPNGVDVERFASAEPEVRDRPYLLTVGRLEEYKGVQHVIRAMPELEAYDLLVAGSGPYREELERVAIEEGVEDRVEFLGYVDDERLPRLYAGADVYVTLSEFEAYGMTVAEALAAGTPCVVRDSGALTDWIDRHSCIDVSNEDQKTVTDAVRTGVDIVPDRSALVTWGDVTDRVETKYNNV